MREPHRRVTARAPIRERLIERARMIIHDYGGAKLRPNNETGSLIDSDTASPRHKRSPAR
jgi:hypothetical protein